MKLLILLTIALNFTSCASFPQYRYEWVLDPQNKPEMDAFWANHKECTDIAFKGRMLGSQYSEADIQTACLQRRGYQFKKIAVN